MKILFVARNYPPHVGGAERLNYELAKNMRKIMSFEVIPNRFGKYSPVFYIYSLFRILLNKGFDAILLSDSLLSPLIPILKIIKKKPVVIKVHGLDITYKNKLYQFFIPMFVNVADKIICISKETKEECVKRGVSPDKCIVIPVGINPPASSDGNKEVLKKRISKMLHADLEDKFVLLSVGRLVERKGFHWFVENVIPKLLEARDDFVYLIVGDGPYREKIKRIVEEKDLRKYVVLLGKIDDRTLELLYKISDIFIMPNIPVDGDIEGFGIVVLEATVRGVPVVASNLEGIKDAVIDGKTGILVTPLNAEMFVENILRIMETTGKNRKIEKKIRQIVLEKYSWNKISRKYKSVFVFLTKMVIGRCKS
ncbi:glycosyltransferase [Geoglobus acetivorans]|uniref:Glycosyltransferase family 4 protein n=1 Tax=Geoglobus acetivorans TaxID=565033 RepID=A0ABZ3H555_GEOAI|nr:glycosyltransferase family 4 protein [Geoglobus acetivorans]